MPRPSVKKERTEEIMQAFERCVVNYGVEGSTLERLAEESGLQRSLIRHYVGNRDDLIKGLLKRYLDSAKEQTAALIEYLPKNNAAEILVEYLFDEQYSDRHSSLLANALFNAAANIAYLAKPLKQSTDHFIDAISDVLKQAYPDSSVEDRYAVANGIVGIYFNIESVDHLGDTARWRAASARSAYLLVRALG